MSTSSLPAAVAPTPHANRLGQLAFCLILLAGIAYLLQLSLAKTSLRRIDPQILSEVRRPGLQGALAPIDAAFAHVWQSQQLQPTPPAEDLAVIRRLSLALTGLPPSLELIRWAESLPDDQRLEQYLAHLLHDPRTHDYLAERLTRSWVGAENGPFIVFRRQRFVTWLSNQLQQNRPYDQIVRDMLTARGLWTDHGPVNFFSAQADGDQDNRIDLVRVAGRVSRNFLGMRIDCLQCHDDFTGGTEFGTAAEPRSGLQTDFHRLASFFGQVRLAPTGLHDRLNAPTYAVELLGDVEPTRLTPAVPYGQAWVATNINSSLATTDSATAGTEPRTNGTYQPPATYETYTNNPAHAVSQLNAADLANAADTATDQAWPSDVPLRQTFAHWLTHQDNRPFARAMVNRVWGLLFGKPLVEPIDNLPLHGPFPPGLEALTDDFIQHGYNLRRLITIIACSRPFRLDSRGQHELTPAHQEHWACFPTTKLRPEQMAGTISQAASLVALDNSTHIVTQLVRFGEEQDFLTRYGDLGDQEFEQDGETVSQRLLLLNGEMATQRLRVQDGLPFNALIQLERLGQSPEQIVELVYLIVLTRRPTPHEVAAIAPVIAEERRAGIEDLLAVLINSSEALWNH